MGGGWWLSAGHPVVLGKLASDMKVVDEKCAYGIASFLIWVKHMGRQRRESPQYREKGPSVEHDGKRQLVQYHLALSS